jgi:hypothetical protein
MTIQLETYQLRAMMRDASETAVEQFAVQMGLLKYQISKTEAYKMYGRDRVDFWLKKGLIKGRFRTP